MIQTTLDYLQNKEFIENVFILQWNNREPETIAYFDKNKLPKYNINYSFLNKILHIPIILNGNIKNRNDDILVNLEWEEGPSYQNIHLLKSHLQKSIRRKDYNKAIQTAKHLIDIDPIQFLRRFSIIFIEDVSLNKHYPTLIWLLIAVSSKKLTLKLNHIEWLLGLVHLACSCPYQEHYPKIENVVDKIKILQPHLEKDKKDIINSLLIRATYGGMGSDMNMILNAAYCWCNRFKNDKKWETYYNKDVRTICINVKPLQHNEWILSAIDYHCFPKMLEWIEEFEEDYKKRLMWHFSSKINYRPFYNPFNEKHDLDENDWIKIRKQVLNISRYVIKKYS